MTVIIQSAIRFVRAWIKPDSKVSVHRLTKCKACVFVEKTRFGTHTCGTLDLTATPPVIGGDVIYHNKVIRLCGCVLEAKTKELDAICPIGRWAV